MKAEQAHAIYCYLESFLSSMQASDLHSSLNHSLQMELRGAEHHLVGLNATEVQDVSDESQQCFARTANGIHEIPLSRRQNSFCIDSECHTAVQIMTGYQARQLHRQMQVVHM